MQAQNNLPAGVNDNHPIFVSGDLGEKECTECNGTGKEPEEIMDWEELDAMIVWHKCTTCEGTGTVPKTEDDLFDEREAKREGTEL